MICISLAASTNREMLSLLEHAAAEPADIHEVRLDTIQEPPAVEQLIEASKRPVMLTCRSRQDNGMYDGSAEAKRELLLRGAAAGAKIIDCDVRDVPFLTEKVKPALLMTGFVDTTGTPENLLSRIEELAKLPVDWIRFVVTHRRPVDSLRVLEAIAASTKPCVGQAMGESGLVTRVLGLAYGAGMVMASLDKGFESAPGQPTAKDLAKIYRVKELTRETAIYGLLGNPVAQSREYRIHNRAFAKLGMDAVYIPFRMESAEDFLEHFPQALNLKGLSVTMPHKPAALAWAEKATETAQRIGAANILANTPKGWRADNTDCAGCFESLKSATDAAGINLTGASALVLGAGGTTRAIGLALTLLGCRVTLTARDPEKAFRAAAQMDWDVEEWDEAPLANWDVVANTTSVGMYPAMEESPFPAKCWHEDMVAFDTIHNPQETRFLRDAAEAGALVVDGVEMFLRQSAEQFRMWTGVPMPTIASLLYADVPLKARKIGK